VRSDREDRAGVEPAAGARPVPERSTRRTRDVSVWPGLTPAVHVRRRVSALPFPLDSPDCRLFAKGRHGLYEGVKQLGLTPGDEILVPAYHHGSEVEALVRAGLVPRFYDLTDGIEPDATELDARMTPRVRALHLTHYLGIPHDTRWRRWCDDRGLLLIDDAAQAWLSEQDGRPTGSDADLAIFCLYKTYGLPDGAAVIGRPSPAAPGDAAGTGLAGTLDRHGAWLVQRWPLGAAVRAVRGRGRPPGAGAEVALGDPSAPSRLTVRLLPRVAARDTAARRRANYRTLSAGLGDLVPRPFRELPPGASPFAFPVAVRDKASVLASLSRRGVHGIDFWSRPHPALPDDYPGARQLRRQVIALPVHQELRADDLERICDALHEAIASS
jgi:dTDP-4-amino-4,6-dideoxygalactose transaminase